MKAQLAPMAVHARLSFCSSIPFSLNEGTNDTFGGTDVIILLWLL